MIGYFKNNRYENGYGKPIECFKCGENKCTGSKSYSLPFGGNGDLPHCADHEQDARAEANKRDGRTTVLNSNVSFT